MMTRIKVLLLFVRFSVAASTASEIIRKDGYCVMYGKQQQIIPRAYNGPAKSVTSDQYNLLKQTCSYLATTPHQNTKACCDMTQLKLLNRNLITVASLFGRCPSTIQNFRYLWCELLCSSNQSKFVNLNLQSAEFFISTKLANDFFNSCRDVEFPGTGSKVIDLMCGYPADQCTPERLLRFIGNPISGAPFPIDFIIGKPIPGVSENKHRMIKCNESYIDDLTGKKILACSHNDCRTTKFFPTTVPPSTQSEIIIIVKSVTTFQDDIHRRYQGKTYKFSGLVHKGILEEMFYLQQTLSTITNTDNAKQISMSDICYNSNSKNECEVMSVLQYFQMNKSNLNKCFTNFGDPCNDPVKLGINAEDWHDQILGCVRQPSSTSNGLYLNLPCISSYGKIVYPSLVFDDFLSGQYQTAKSLKIRIALKDSVDQALVHKWIMSMKDHLDGWKKKQETRFQLFASVSVDILGHSVIDVI